MGDERLREAERRWRATGDPGDVAAWLRLRVKAGELPAERLRWAASCGHEGALRALDGAAPSRDLGGLAAEVHRTGAAVAARFWLAVVRAGWSVLGDDRFVAILWSRERRLLGRPTRALFTLDYATRASDVLSTVEEHSRQAAMRLRGFDPGASPPHLDSADALDALLRDVPRATLLETLRADWAPWLLGERDPVAERVEASPDEPVVEGAGFQDA